LEIAILAEIQTNEQVPLIAFINCSLYRRSMIDCQVRKQGVGYERFHSWQWSSPRLLFDFWQRACLPQQPEMVSVEDKWWYVLEWGDTSSLIPSNPYVWMDDTGSGIIHSQNLICLSIKYN
jgi:hypothetical protein